MLIAKREIVGFAVGRKVRHNLVDIGFIGRKQRRPDTVLMRVCDALGAGRRNDRCGRRDALHAVFGQHRYVALGQHVHILEFVNSAGEQCPFRDIQFARTNSFGEVMLDSHFNLRQGQHFSFGLHDLHTEIGRLLDAGNEISFQIRRLIRLDT